MPLTDFRIVQPSTIEEAVQALARSTQPVDSFTQRANLDPDTLTQTFARPVRRPQWVWIAQTESGEQLGVIAAWGFPTANWPAFFDILAVPLDRPEIAKELLARAITDSLAMGSSELEILQFARAERPGEDPAVQAVSELIRSCGYRLLVQRLHYRVDVGATKFVLPPTRLRFEPVAGAGDPRLQRVFEEILVGSLDAHDVAALTHLSAASVAARMIEEYAEVDPIDSFFLAIDEAGNVVGLVIGGLRGGTERGTTSYIGVSHLHRGHGYAGQLLGWITARIVEQGPSTIIAETDLDNVPMARAFAALGYPQTESRFDFVSET
jgi:GNAT superfamily N-acetyltransferase